MNLRDLVGEALAGISWRPGRSILTSFGTVLGTAAVVSVLGFTSTAHAAVNARFNSLLATTVTLQDNSPVLAGVDPAFPDGFESRLEELPGLLAAGTFWQANIGNDRITTGNDAYEHQILAPERATIDAVTHGTFAAIGARMSAGSPITQFEEVRGENVAVLGASVAESIGLPALAEQPSVFIGGHPFLVVGILADDRQRPDALLSVLVPQRTALRIWGAPAEGEQAIVRTEPGAAFTLAAEIPAQLHPESANRIEAVAAATPELLRNEVNADLNSLFLILGGVALFIGMMGIGNTTLVSVIERTDEIGLRRALGAQKRHISFQFLIESGFLGGFGGIIGGALGTLAVAALSADRNWTPVINHWVVVAAPLAGILTGLIAGMYPALRAANLEPAEALRR